MDISFDIINTEGDQVKVALSYYDTTTIGSLSSSPDVLSLVFYDVTLVREYGNDFVGYKMLSVVSDTLAHFLIDNDDAVLCFYCDAQSEIKRSHASVSPQEYRSLLFSRMFDRYTSGHCLKDFVNHRVRLEIDDNPDNDQFAHFICRKRHEEAVADIERKLMELDK